MNGLEQPAIRHLPGLHLLLVPDAAFTVVEASDDFLRAVDLDRDAVVSRGVQSALSRLDRTDRKTFPRIVHHMLERVASTGRESTSTSERQDPRLPSDARDGGGHWEARQRPVLSPNGKVAYVVLSLVRVNVAVRPSEPFAPEAVPEAGDRLAMDKDTPSQGDGEMLATDILESITEGFFGLNHDWRFTYVNHEAQHILGRPAKELVGKDIWVEYPGLFGSPFEASYRQAMDDREASSMIAFYPDHDCYYDVHTYPASHGISVYFRNVTDRIRAEAKRKEDEQAIREQAQRLLELDQAKDRFLATLSHELRNPLAPLRNAAQVLGTLNPGDERLEWVRQVIDRQVRQMGLLLDDLLNAARITQGKLVLKREAVDLSDVVATSLESARPLIDAKRHRLTVTLPDTPVTLNADPLRLSQIVSNLLHNAAKYTDAGGDIALEARTDDEGLTLTVRDNGIGVDPAAQKTIFAMFSQAEGAGARSEGGLGIGLALAKHLLEMHGGSISVESPGTGQGSTFTVRLPRAIFDVGDAPKATEAAVPAHVPPSTILIADDNQDAADVLAMLLRLSGHDVHVAYGGGDALRLAFEHRPRFVLLDIGMPDLDGHEVARRLRAQPWAADMTLVALTGFGQDEDKRRSAQSGFDRHLTKPVDPADVNAILSHRAAGSVRHAPTAGV